MCIPSTRNGWYSHWTPPHYWYHPDGSLHASTSRSSTEGLRLVLCFLSLREASRVLFPFGKRFSHCRPTSLSIHSSILRTRNSSRRIDVLLHVGVFLFPYLSFGTRCRFCSCLVWYAFLVGSSKIERSKLLEKNAMDEEGRADEERDVEIIKRGKSLMTNAVDGEREGKGRSCRGGTQNHPSNAKQEADKF